MHKLHQMTIQEIMIRQGLNSLKIGTSMIKDIQVVSQFIVSKYIQRWQINDPVLPILQKMKEVFKILKKIHSDITMSYLIKKIFFIHLFIRETARRKIINIEVQQLIIKQIKQTQQNITEMANPKRSKSVKKIIGLFRDLSGFKDKSKMKMENADQPHLMNDILIKNLRPYCHYLLQIIQDQEAYRAISTEIEGSNKIYRWKIIKWSIVLGDIIISLNKIGKYFVEQIMPIWLFMSYLISIDVSIYISIIKQRIQKESLRWANDLIINYKFCQINPRAHKGKIVELMGNDQLISLKRQIQQWMKLKQMFNYLYCNRFLSKWKELFVMPKKYPDADEAGQKFITVIDQLYKKMNMKNITSERIEQHKIKDRPRSTQISIVRQSQQIRTNRKQSKQVENLQTNEQLKDQTKMINDSKKNDNIQTGFRSLAFSQKGPAPVRSNNFIEKRNKLIGKS